MINSPPSGIPVKRNSLLSIAFSLETHTCELLHLFSESMNTTVQLSVLPVLNIWLILKVFCS